MCLITSLTPGKSAIRMQIFFLHVGKNGGEKDAHVALFVIYSLSVLVAAICYAFVIRHANGKDTCCAFIYPDHCESCIE